MTEHVKTNDSVYITANFYHPVSGFSYAADATPRYLVYESGATLILQGDMTVRSTIVGSYWANFVASAANGFDAGYFYDVQVSGTVGGVSGFTKVKEFVLDDVFSANVVQVSGQSISPKTIYDANVVSVSGLYVSLADFGGGTGASAADVWNATLSSYQTVGSAGYALNVASGNLIGGVSSAPTVQQIRAEMDANSLMFTAISGEVAGLNGYNIHSDLMAVSGSILQANVVQVSGEAISQVGIVDANIVQMSGIAISPTNLIEVDVIKVSGVYVSIEDFQGEASSLTAAAVRTEMDANSLMFSAISGEVAGLNGYNVQTGLMSVSGVINTISNNVTNIDSDIVAMSGSIMRANIVQVSGYYVSGDATVDVNVVQVSGEYVSMADFGTSSLTAADVRTEMDANSLMFVAISGQNIRTINNLTAVSGSILLANLVQVSGVPVDINSFDFNNDIYFAHIKFVSDLTNNQDEFVVQWFKNDQPVSSGSLTNPRLSVYNTSNGSAVINGVAMSYASPNLGVVRYNTSMVLASGEPYLVETSGTIDSVMRSWKTIIGIDLI